MLMLISMESGGAPRRSEEEGAAASVATCPEYKNTFPSRKTMHGHLTWRVTRRQTTYRGDDPNRRAKLFKIETAAAGGDGGPPSLVVNTNFLFLMTEHERLQNKKLIKRRVIKDDTEGNGKCSTSAGIAPRRECECFVCHKWFSS